MFTRTTFAHVGLRKLNTVFDSERLSHWRRDFSVVILFLSRGLVGVSGRWEDESSAVAGG